MLNKALPVNGTILFEHLQLDLLEAMKSAQKALCIGGAYDFVKWALLSAHDSSNVIHKFHKNAVLGSFDSLPWWPYLYRVLFSGVLKKLHGTRAKWGH